MTTTARTTVFRPALRPVLASAIALGFALTASACGGSAPGGTSAGSEEAPAADAADDAAAGETGSDEGGSEETGAGTAEGGESGDSAAAPAGEQTLVEIGETIEDPDMGDTIDVLSAVRDFPSEEQADLIADGGEVVLLEVSVAPGEDYGGLVSMGNFEISWDDGADFWNNKTRMVEDELNDADHPVLEDVSRRDGGEHTGWMAFFVDERVDSYTIRYERSGAEVIGSDEVIDPFKQDFEIPAA